MTKLLKVNHDIHQETLHTIATKVTKEKNERYELKKRKKMRKYRMACVKAAKRGYFCKSFKLKDRGFNKVSMTDFEYYFSFDRDFKISYENGKVLINW